MAYDPTKQIPLITNPNHESIFVAYMVRTIGMDIIFYKDLNINVMSFFKDTFVKLLIPLVLCLVKNNIHTNSSYHISHKY